MTTRVKVKSRPIELLLVEDNPGDVLLMKEIMKISKFPIHWTLARDGEKALDMLHDAENFSKRGEPDLILLDLNLPRLDGREVLHAIKNDQRLEHIPVIILTSSQNSEDVAATYHDHASFHIVKPMDMNHFAVIVKYIEDFWLQKIKLR